MRIDLWESVAIDSILCLIQVTEARKLCEVSGGFQLWGLFKMGWSLGIGGLLGMGSSQGIGGVLQGWEGESSGYEGDRSFCFWVFSWGLGVFCRGLWCSSAEISLSC